MTWTGKVSNKQSRITIGIEVIWDWLRNQESFKEYQIHRCKVPIPVAEIQYPRDTIHHSWLITRIKSWLVRTRLWITGGVSVTLHQYNLEICPPGMTRNLRLWFRYDLSPNGSYAGSVVPSVVMLTGGRSPVEGNQVVRLHLVNGLMLPCGSGSAVVGVA